MKKIIRALTGAAAIYNEPLKEDRMDGYLMILKDYNEDDVVDAIGKLMHSCKFFPKPAEIIEVVKDKTERSYYDSRHPKWEQLPAADPEPDTPEMIKNRKQVNQQVDDICREFSKKMGWE